MEEEIKVDLPKEPNSPSNKKKHEPTLDEPILDTIVYFSIYLFLKFLIS